MIGLQGTKVITIVPPATTSAAGTFLGTVDTIGYDCAKIFIVQGSASGATNVYQAITVKECDTSNGSFAALTGCVSGTDYTVPTNIVTTATAITAVPIVFDIDLRGRKRYLELAYTTGTVCSAGGVCILGKAESMPDSATEVNANSYLAC